MTKQTSLKSLNDNFMKLYRVNYDSKVQTVNKSQYRIMLLFCQIHIDSTNITLFRINL